MQLRQFNSIEEFATMAGPFLAANEAAHCLPLGLIATLRANASVFPEPPLLATVETDAGEVAGVAMRTPPHNLILSLTAPSISEAEVIAATLAGIGAPAVDFPGVTGPAAMARIFGAMWAAKTHRTPELRTHERIYELSAVIPPQPVTGSMRPAKKKERDLLVRWHDAFMVEALRESDPQRSEAQIDMALNHPDSSPRTFLVWEDGAPVSLAGYTGPTPNGMRIGPVYTPPEHRKKGYASALVAALSQHLLDSGRTRCFLFTDLANPTSNKIYQAIGYEPVIDWDEYRFPPR